MADMGEINRREENINRSENRNSVTYSILIFTITGLLYL